jgi:hypothetical protein
MSGIGQLLQALTAILPLKVVIGLGVAVAIGLAPYWLESIRDRQIRGTVRQMVRAEPEDRERLVQRVFELTGDKRQRLLTLVEVAIKYDQRGLRDQAIVRLESTGGTADAARLRKRIEPEKPRFRDALEAAVRIEALVSAGLTAAAEEQLAIARAAFPSDSELAELARRIAGPATDGAPGGQERVAEGGPAYRADERS